MPIKGRDTTDSFLSHGVKSVRGRCQLGVCLLFTLMTEMFVVDRYEV